jgi:hypothetical protein
MATPILFGAPAFSGMSVYRVARHDGMITMAFEKEAYEARLPRMSNLDGWHVRLQSLSRETRNWLGDKTWRRVHARYLTLTWRSSRQLSDKKRTGAPTSAPNAVSEHPAIKLRCHLYQRHSREEFYARVPRHSGSQKPKSHPHTNGNPFCLPAPQQHHDV